ncbi:putative Dynein light chain protein [Naja naja]|nr:putative Dynein light chain protein [Naja naja]
MKRLAWVLKEGSRIIVSAGSAVLPRRSFRRCVGGNSDFHLSLSHSGQTMADTGEGKKEEADYKRLHSFPLIRHSDMPEEMRVEAMELCVTACEKYATNNESAAKMIKETMDKKFGSSWHVVIGEGFGFEITHEVKNLLYMFFGGSLAVCVWKCS